MMVTLWQPKHVAEICNNTFCVFVFISVIRQCHIISRTIQTNCTHVLRRTWNARLIHSPPKTTEPPERVAFPHSEENSEKILNY